MHEVELLALERVSQSRQAAGTQDDVGERTIRRNDRRASNRDHIVGGIALTAGPRVKQAREAVGRVVASDDPRFDAKRRQRSRLLLGVFDNAAAKRPGIGNNDPDLQAIRPREDRPPI